MVQSCKPAQYVFACGPWLGELFPETIGNRIRPTRQEVTKFRPPAGDQRFDETRLPVWADHRDKFIYGIPGTQGRGFKIANNGVARNSIQLQAIEPSLQKG